MNLGEKIGKHPEGFFDKKEAELSRIKKLAGFVEYFIVRGCENQGIEIDFDSTPGVGLGISLRSGVRVIRKLQPVVNNRSMKYEPYPVLPLILVFDEGVEVSDSPLIKAVIDSQPITGEGIGNPDRNVLSMDVEGERVFRAIVQRFGRGSSYHSRRQESFMRVFGKNTGAKSEPVSVFDDVLKHIEEGYSWEEFKYLGLKFSKKHARSELDISFFGVELENRMLKAFDEDGRLMSDVFGFDRWVDLYWDNPRKFFNKLWDETRDFPEPYVNKRQANLGVEGLYVKVGRRLKKVDYKEIHEAVVSLNIGQIDLGLSTSTSGNRLIDLQRVTNDTRDRGRLRVDYELCDDDSVDIQVWLESFDGGGWIRDSELDISYFEDEDRLAKLAGMLGGGLLIGERQKRQERQYKEKGLKHPHQRGKKGSKRK